MASKRSARALVIAQCLVALSVAALIVPSPAHATVLLNDATDTREAAFPSFLDDTWAATQAWAFPKSSDHTLLTGGALSSLNVVAVGPTGGAGITISNSENGGVPRTADLNGYSWAYGYGGADIAARNELANDGGGIWSLGGDLTINIPASIVPAGMPARVELLAVAGLANVRTMDVAANGVPFATDWDLIRDGANHWNSVLGFTVTGNATGVTLVVGGGSFGDVNPYIHALSVTPVPEPATLSLLALGGLALLRRRRTH